MNKFDHEKLDVYHLALDFVTATDSITRQLPKGTSYLSDQLRRSALSITLNIAEGAGEFSKNEKRRFYRIALRSGTESAAALDVCRRLAVAEEEQLDTGIELLLRVVSMLSRLARVPGDPPVGVTAQSGNGDEEHQLIEGLLGRWRPGPAAKP